jgi:hypothetical protein
LAKVLSQKQTGPIISLKLKIGYKIPKIPTETNENITLPRCQSVQGSALVRLGGGFPPNQHFPHPRPVSDIQFVAATST